MKMDASVRSTVGRGTTWLAGTTLVMKGLSFLSVLLVLNRLTLHEYGSAELVLTAIPLLSLFLLPGLSTTVIADMGRQRGVGDLPRMKGLFFSFLRLQAYFAILLWAAVFFGAHFLAVEYGKEEASTLFKIISFAFLLSPVRICMQALQSVYFEFKQQSLYSIAEELFKLLLLALFFFMFDMRTEGLVLAIVLSQAVGLLAFSLPFVRIDSSFWSTKQTRYPTFHFLFHHGKWGVFSSYLGVFGRNIRPWIIKFFLGTEAVGIYAVAQGLIGHTMSLVPLDRVIIPMLPQYVHLKERFHHIVAKAIKYELAGYALVSIAAAVFSPFFIGWFFPQYLSSVPLFQITLLMLISVAFDIIFGGVFYALQAQRNLFFASLYKLVLVIVLTPVMIHFFGLFGIAYANILSNSLYTWERYRSLKKLMPGFSLDWRDFFTVDADDIIILSELRALAVRYLRIFRIVKT